MTTGTRLTPERIAEVMDAHALGEPAGEKALDFMGDILTMAIDRRLSPKQVACALELLAHLRNDLCGKP
jgi:hypothetical protein